jgi:hypothetical protein
MSEENVTKYRCERCGHIEEVPMKPGVLGGTKKAKRPASWGNDKENIVLYCPGCLKAYNEGYASWFTEFMKNL